MENEGHVQRSVVGCSLSVQPQLENPEVLSLANSSGNAKWSTISMYNMLIYQVVQWDEYLLKLHYHAAAVVQNVSPRFFWSKTLL